MPDNSRMGTRSFNMSKIRKTDTKPELLVRRYLHQNGFRYRLYRRDLPGTPDMVLAKYRQVIFVNGCFWHAHEGCKYNRLPKTRVDYWHPKIAGNVARDISNHERILAMGWSLIVVWECELKKDRFQFTMDSIISSIQNHKNRK